MEYVDEKETVIKYGDTIFISFVPTTHDSELLMFSQGFVDNNVEVKNKDKISLDSSGKSYTQ